MNSSGYAFVDEDDCKKTSIVVKRCIDCKEKLTYKPDLYIRCFHCNRDHWLIKEENLKSDIKERRNERRALNIRPFMREAREG